MLALVVICMVALLGFTALAVDAGLLYVTKGELQRAADAAAMAGATAYFTDAGMKAEQDTRVLTLLATQRARAISEQNLTLGAKTYLDAGDVRLGVHDFSNRAAPLATAGRWNAVEVITQRTRGSQNRPVPLLFARIFGTDWAEVSASARAAASDQFAGYRAVSGVLTPFTIQENLYESLRMGGPDEFSYTFDVDMGGDGIPEVKLYPWKLSGNGKKSKKKEAGAGEEESDGSGNFGTLNVGDRKIGLAVLEDHIANGIPALNLEQEFGGSELMFYDDAGNAITYPVGGQPGLSAGMKDTLEMKVGDIIGFFTHRTVGGSGRNAEYLITGIRFARIMEAQLTGSMDDKRLVVQPVPWSDGNVIVSESAPSSNGQLGRVMLVK